MSRGRAAWGVLAVAVASGGLVLSTLAGGVVAAQAPAATPGGVGVAQLAQVRPSVSPSVQVSPSPTVARATASPTSVGSVGGATRVATPLPTATVGPTNSGSVVGLGWIIGLVVVLIGGAFGVRRLMRRRDDEPRQPAVPRLKPVKDAGQQRIELDHPAVVFHTQFGSGDEFQWDQQA